jgi:hypothetical protein
VVAVFGMVVPPVVRGSCKTHAVDRDCAPHRDEDRRLSDCVVERTGFSQIACCLYCTGCFQVMHAVEFFIQSRFSCVVSSTSGVTSRSYYTNFQSQYVWSVRVHITQRLSSNTSIATQTTSTVSVTLLEGTYS